MSEKTARDELPDFLMIWKRYREVLTNGQRSEIRRVREPDDLDVMPAFYRLLLPLYRPTARLRQVVFFLPSVSHSEEGGNLGRQLRKGNVSEARLFQMVRSGQPQDLLHLRRLCQQVHPVVSWQQFGKTLFYWGDNAKRRIVEQYYLAEMPEKEPVTV